MTSEPDEGRGARTEPAPHRNPVVRDSVDAESGWHANPRVRERPAAVPARHLPIPGVIGTQDATREASGPATPVPPASGEQPSRGTPKSQLSGAVADAIGATTNGGHAGAGESGSVAHAAGQGFVNGFVGGAAAPRGHAVPAAELQARMERFPELRGVQVPDRRAARLAELGGSGTAEGVRQSAQDGDRER